MSGTDLKPLIYNLLAMPDYSDSQSLSIGLFRPADSLELVREVASRRVAQIKRAVDLQGLRPTTRNYARSLLFHTFDDFLLEQRRQTPTRAQDLPAGSSLERFKTAGNSNLSAYLDYLKTTAPDLWEFLQRPLPAHILESERQRHTYLLGRSGSGKSDIIKVLMHNYFTLPEPPTIILIDPAGKLARQVAQWRENAKSDQLVYIDPLLGGERLTPCFNPLQLTNPTAHNVDLTAQALVSAFEKILQDTNLSNQMKTLLIPCLTVLLTRTGSTLLDLMAFMGDDSALKSELVGLGCQSKNPAHARFFQQQIFEQHSYKITKSSIITKLQSLLNSQIFYNLVIGKNTFDIPALLDSRKLIIFKLSKGTMSEEISQAYGRFLLATIQAQIFQRQHEQAGDLVPVQLFIDEFQNYISPTMAEMLAESRQFSLHLTLAQQYLGQNMPADFKKAVLSNTQIKISGLNSNDTLAAMSREMGVNTEQLANLGQGDFWLKVGNRPACKFRGPDLILDDKNAMSAKQWEAIKAQQLAHFYQPVNLNEEITPMGEIVGERPEPIPAKPQIQNKDLPPSIIDFGKHRQFKEPDKADAEQPRPKPKYDIAPINKPDEPDE